MEIIHKLKGLTSESYGCENNRNTSWISGLYKLNNVALMLQQLKGLRRSISYVMKRVLFVNKSCTKGESFLLKIRGWTCGQSISV